MVIKNLPLPVKIGIGLFTPEFAVSSNVSNSKIIKEKINLYYRIAMINLEQGNIGAARQAAQKGRKLIPITEVNPYSRIDDLLQNTRTS